MTAITATTMKIPTPIPALKIPPTTSQLVNERARPIINKPDRIKFFILIIFFDLNVSNFYMAKVYI